LARDDVVYVELFVPTFTLLFFHWYKGETPPFVGVAVKVTGVPEQIAPEGEAAMLTPAGNRGFTTIVTPAEVAGLPVAHVAFEVRTQVMTSPLTGIKLYVELLVPALMPLTFH
jgi:hypothetical protein